MTRALQLRLSAKVWSHALCAAAMAGGPPRKPPALHSYATGSYIPVVCYCSVPLMCLTLMCRQCDETFPCAALRS